MSDMFTKKPIDKTPPEGVDTENSAQIKFNRIGPSFVIGAVVIIAIIIASIAFVVSKNSDDKPKEKQAQAVENNDVRGGHHFDATTNLTKIYNAQYLAKSDKGSYLMGPQLSLSTPSLITLTVDDTGKYTSYYTDINEESNVYVISANEEKFCAVAVSSNRQKPFSTINQLNVYQAASIDETGKIVYANEGQLCADASTNLADLGRFTSDGFYAPRAVAKKPW